MAKFLPKCGYNCYVTVYVIIVVFGIAKLMVCVFKNNLREQPFNISRRIRKIWEFGFWGGGGGHGRGLNFRFTG